MKWQVALLLCIGSFGPRTAAADQTIAVAPGWQLELGKNPYALSPNGAAVVLYKRNVQPPPFYEQTRIVQIVNGATVSATDFTGTIQTLEYSPDGQLLLAMEYPTTAHGESVSRRIHLLRLNGTTRWTKDVEGQSYHFSSGGDHIYTTQWTGDLRSGPKLSLMDLDGNETKRLDFGIQLDGALVLDAPLRVIVVMRDTVSSFDPTVEPMATSWTTTVGPNDSPIYKVRQLDSGRFIAEEKYGRFMMFSNSGTILYRYDNAALAQGDPQRTEGDYGGYDLYALAGQLILYDGTTRGFQVDLAGPTLTPRTFNASVPTGCVLKEGIAHGKAIILCPTQIRIRPIN